MQIEPKIQDPINIRLSKTANEIMEDKTVNKSYPLIPGAMIGGEHYGFIIVSDTTRGQNEEIYPTASRITGAEIKEGILRIYEDGKYHPWKFKLDGTLIDHAKFNEMSRRDWEYLAENFQGYTEEDMTEANTFRKR